MSGDILVLLIQFLGTLLGAAVAWGVTKTKIENILRDMGHMLDWKESHERWANQQNTDMIERATENKVRIVKIEEQLANIEKRAWKT